MGTLLYEYKGRNCEIKDLEGMLIAFGRLANIIEGETTTIEIVPLDDKNEIPLMEFNKNIKLSFRSKEDIIILYGQVFISDRRYLKVANIRTFDSFERREFFRVRSRGHGFIEVKCEEEEDEYIELELRDVSLSGVKFALEVEIPIGVIISIVNLKIYKDDSPFNFTCNVIDRFQTEKDIEKGIYQYRCSIREIPDKELDRLCGVIFKIQRDEVRKLKESAMNV